MHVDMNLPKWLQEYCTGFVSTCHISTVAPFKQRWYLPGVSLLNNLKPSTLAFIEEVLKSIIH